MVLKGLSCMTLTSCRHVQKRKTWIVQRWICCNEKNVRRAEIARTRINIIQLFKNKERKTPLAAKGEQTYILNVTIDRNKIYFIHSGN